MPSARLYTEVAGTRSGPASAHGRGSVATLGTRGVARSTIRDAARSHAAPRTTGLPRVTIPRTLPGAILASCWAYRPPRLQPTRLTRRPEARCNSATRERSSRTTRTVLPRLVPRLQPDTSWPRTRKTLRSSSVAGLPASSPGRTSTGWPSPRRAVASSGQVAKRAARSSPARGASVTSRAREGTRGVVTGPGSLGDDEAAPRRAEALGEDRVERRTAESLADVGDRWRRPAVAACPAGGWCGPGPPFGPWPPC